MADLYEKALVKSIAAANATERIVVVPHTDAHAASVDAFSKVPPQHLIETRAQRQVQNWLRGSGGLHKKGNEGGRQNGMS